MKHHLTTVSSYALGAGIGTGIKRYYKNLNDASDECIHCIEEQKKLASLIVAAIREFVEKDEA